MCHYFCKLFEILNTKFDDTNTTLIFQLPSATLWQPCLGTNLRTRIWSLQFRCTFAVRKLHDPLLPPYLIVVFPHPRPANGSSASSDSRTHQQPTSRIPHPSCAPATTTVPTMPDKLSQEAMKNMPKSCRDKYNAWLKESEAAKAAGRPAPPSPLGKLSGHPSVPSSMLKQK